MNEAERELIASLLRSRISWLTQQIFTQEQLSEPCPPGHWRWADMKTSGYGRKTDAELAADRARAAERATKYRAERDTAVSALRNISE